LYSLHAATIDPHSLAIVPTGITVEIPDGYVGLLKPKGRNDHLVGAGVVDAGYQGEILVKVINPFDRALTIKVGEAIAQLLILPIETPMVEEISLEEIHSQRSPRGGSGGIVDQSSRT
jgi:dUTP pyrophosphatase